jgi:hypothetical protein
MAAERERRAVKRIAAGLRREIDNAAVEAAELGRRAVALDLEFLDGVDVGKERHLPGLRLQHGNAVEQILVGARPSAIDARKRRRRRGRHGDAGHERRERDEAAAVERQIDNLPVVDDVAKPGCVAAQQRRVSRDRDRFGDGAKLELQLETDGLAGGEPNTVARQRPEAARLDPHLIRARHQPGDEVTPFLASDGRANLVRRRRDDAERCTRDRRTRLIHDAAGERASTDLCGDRRGEGQQPEQPKTHASTVDRFETCIKST